MARVRRTAEDARNAILDATEQRLVQSGPAGIRLQEVAADVGVAHTTILHHFGSRERLVAEVVKRRIDALNAEVLSVVARGNVEGDVVPQLLRRLFTTFADEGHARVTAFLALEGSRNPSIDGVLPLMRALHAMRLLRGVKSDPQDSEFLVLLTTFALFGEAVAGPLFRAEDPGAPDSAARERFIEGLTRFVQSQLEPTSAAPEVSADPARSVKRRARSGTATSNKPRRRNP